VREMGASVIKGRMNGADTWVSVQIFGLQSLPVSEKSCILPPQELLRQIEIKKAEIGSLGERLTRLKQELDAEIDSVESEKSMVGNDAKRNYDLNLKIKSYNEKSVWYNQSLAEMKAKQSVLSSMVEEYNKAFQSYRDCEASG
jgi:chromosome segregation ATPase